MKRESLRGDGRRVDIVLSRRGVRLVEKAFHDLLVRQNEIHVSLVASKARTTIESLDTLLDEFAEANRRIEESRLNEIA